MATVSFPTSSSSFVVSDRRLNSLSNPDLLALSQAGNKEAAHALISRFQPLINALAWRLTSNPSDAADLVSEAYLRVYAVINSCRSIETLPGWIKKITINVFNRLYTRNRRAQGVSLEHLMEVAGDHFIPSADSDPASEVLGAMENEERLRRMRLAVDSLSAPYRDIVERFYLNSQSYEEIAQQTGLSLGTVKSRLFRAREALQRKLGDLIA